jgi:hypothetical protein
MTVPTNVLIQYTMVGQLLTNSGPNAYQNVYWDVYNAPDLTGQYSGYFGQLQNISVSSTANISSPTSGVVIPTSSAGGDLSGNYPNPTVSGIQNQPVADTPPTSGQSLVFNGTQYVPQSMAGGGFVAGGDLSGSSTNQTVIAVHGTTIPAGGSLLTGNVPQVTGPGALSYAAVNLAGGTQHVSGLLPTANQANQTLTGDVTGNTGAAVVAAVNGVAVAGTPSSGNIMTATGPANAHWAPPAGGSGLTTGLASARPSATGSQNRYQCTDIPVQYTDTGVGTWTGVLSNFLNPPAAAASYTAVGNIALYQQADAIRAVNTVAAGTGVGLKAGSLPQNGQWQVTLHIVPLFQPNATFPEFALVVANGTTSGTSVSYNIGFYSTSGVGIHATRDVIGTTTRQALYIEPSNTTLNSGTTGGTHFRFLNDGATMHMQYSNDGYSWVTLYGVDSPAGLTNYGFWLGCENNSTTAAWSQALILQQTLQSSLTAPPQAVTGATGNAVPVTVTVASTAGYFVGDVCSVKGMVGNTAANTGSNATGMTATLGLVITAMTGTTITFGEVNGNGTWTSGGEIVLVSR